MKKTSLAVAALLTSLSTVSVIPAAYAEDGMNMNSVGASTEQGCKKCKCTCGDKCNGENGNCAAYTGSCSGCAGSVDATEDQKNCSGCQGCSGN
jgi:hypothetical protein